MTPDDTTSYAEITMKSGAVVTFECTELTWKRTAVGASLGWKLPPGAKRQPIHLNLEEIAAIVFVGKD